MSVQNVQNDTQWSENATAAVNVTCSADDVTCTAHKPANITVWLAIGLSVAGLMVMSALVVLAIRLYRRYRHGRDLASTSWLVCHNDLVFVRRRLFKSIPSIWDSEADIGSESHVSFESHDTFEMTKGIGQDGQTAAANGVKLPPVFTVTPVTGHQGHDHNLGQGRLSWPAAMRTALLDGQRVAVKTVYKRVLPLTTDLVVEMNEMRNIRHANVNAFIGACVEPDHVSLLMAYCVKGSIRDLVRSERFKLDNIFKLSFAVDIASGMEYLHSTPVVCHGHLKSSNVVVDQKWACKITDYGAVAFRHGEQRPHVTHSQRCYELLWTAPEHLRQMRLTPYSWHQGQDEEEEEEEDEGGARWCDISQKGDVYSFAIIMQEIIMKQTPFDISPYEAPGTIGRLVQREHPPYRPRVSRSGGVEALVDLVLTCWEEIPAFRPTFATIADSVRRLSRQRFGQVSLVDQMMHMMQKYADHLEEMVEERTKQLADEQRKTDMLLARMLPRSVAEELKKGHAVEPELYDCVTIYFSDIVDFTVMSSQLSPMQVVDILNDLYTCFDSTIENYDVYKVETIGDAYMVTSGLPERNGTRHAGEVCTMALDLLAHMTSFRIRHVPDRQLQLRIGIHSGPVVAGVVGVKMPRYCLFGDTVNTASRMESSGLALRIHVSSTCKQLLDELGGYQVEQRGLTAMKGKGAMMTYFLHSKEGFACNLPDLTRALPLAEHSFK